MSQFVSPFASPRSELEAVEGISFGSMSSRRLVGILDNAKTNSAPLLKAVADRLQDRLAVKGFVWRDKRAAPTAPASAESIERLSACDLVVVGLGS